MLKLYIVGAVAKDATVAQYQGSTVINFTLALRNQYNDSYGTLITKVLYVRCAYWLKTGKTDKISQYLNKDTEVHVEGVPTPRTYLNSQGIPSVCIDLPLSSLTFTRIVYKEEQRTPGA